ncbi:glycosyltransferase [Klebsiella pneumoniae]|nr:glycosyltransferase [Klebsiella pneumoniae]
MGATIIARHQPRTRQGRNINNALKYAKGEFVYDFDCDHVPTRSFLPDDQAGFLKEKELAYDADPAPLLSRPDPFERNLVVFAKNAERRDAILRPVAGRERHVDAHLLRRLLPRYPPAARWMNLAIAVET